MGNIKTLKDYCNKIDLSNTLTISELEVKEFDGEYLSADELKALSNYRRDRIEKLKKKSGSEASFHKSYEYIRSLSNLVDYKEFLNDQSPLL